MKKKTVLIGASILTLAFVAIFDVEFQFSKKVRNHDVPDALSSN